jgi:hypothetical protein
MTSDWQKNHAGQFDEIDAKKGVSGEAPHTASHHLWEGACVLLAQVSSFYIR